MVHGARPAEPTGCRSRVICVIRPARLAARFERKRVRAVEAEGFGQELVARALLPLVGAHACKPLEGEVPRDLRVLRRQRLVGARLGRELQTKALRVLEAEEVAFEGGLDPAGSKPARPDLGRL